MGKNERVWLEDRIKKAEKRLAHHRLLARSLENETALKAMNDRALIDLEVRLFRMRMQRVA